MHRIAICLAVLVSAGAAAAAAAQNTWYVDASAALGGNGSAGAPLVTIQSAIVAAANGDTILVRPGTYFENINFLGRAVAVRSTLGAAATTIDGNFAGSVVQFTSGEGRASSLRGFEVRRGSALSGAGIVCSGASPTIADCMITANVAWAGGGGVHCTGGNALIQRCTITGNSAQQDGGGVGCNGTSTAEIADSAILANSAVQGGGISANTSALRIARCLIDGNTAVQGGGGIHSFGGAIDVSASQITNNTAPIGGGAQDFQSSSVYTSCAFRGNIAIAYGGGLAAISSPTIVVSSTFFGNGAPFGGALFDYTGSLDVRHCTAAGNVASTDGGALGFFASLGPRVANSILKGNLPNDIGAYFGQNLAVRSSDVGGGHPGAGNFDANPQFADPFAGDLHILWTSPCRNGGDATLHPLAAIDADGQPRANGAVDVGADEAYRVLAGSGEDIHLSVEIDGQGAAITPKLAPAFALATVRMSSPLGLYFGFPPALIGQPYHPSLPPNGVGGFPGVHLDPQFATVVFDGLYANVFGPVVLGPAPIALNYVIPPGIGGYALRLQAIVGTTGAANGFFAISDAHDLIF